MLIISGLRGEFDAGFMRHCRVLGLLRSVLCSSASAMFVLALITFGGGLLLVFYCMADAPQNAATAVQPSNHAVYQARSVSAAPEASRAARSWSAHRKLQRTTTSVPLVDAEVARIRSDYSLQLDSTGVAQKYSLPPLSAFGGSAYGVAAALSNVGAGASSLPANGNGQTLTSVPETNAWSAAGVVSLLFALARRRKLH